MGDLSARHRSTEFLASLRGVDASVPPEMSIHLITDSCATHKTDKVRAWRAARPRYDTHLTPVSASWMNLIEWFFSMLSGKWSSARHMSATRILKIRSAVNWKPDTQTRCHVGAIKRPRTSLPQSVTRHEHWTANFQWCF